MREFVACKLHGLRVTDKSLNYHGSASLPPSLMQLADISPFERVYCVNKTNGLRWDTYAIQGPEQQFALNGAAARLGEIGDEILLWTYRRQPLFTGATVLMISETNTVIERLHYLPNGDIVSDNEQLPASA